MWCLSCELRTADCWCTGKVGYHECLPCQETRASFRSVRPGRADSFPLSENKFDKSDSTLCRISTTSPRRAHLLTANRCRQRRRLSTLTLRPLTDVKVKVNQPQGANKLPSAHHLFDLVDTMPRNTFFPLDTPAVRHVAAHRV